MSSVRVCRRCGTDLAADDEWDCASCFGWHSPQVQRAIAVDIEVEICGGRRIPLDSHHGIVMLMDWARVHKAVLNASHARLAKKYEVSTDGVRFSSPIL